MSDQTDEDRAREAFEAWMRVSPSGPTGVEFAWLSFLAGRASAEAEVERRIDEAVQRMALSGG